MILVQINDEQNEYLKINENWIIKTIIDLRKKNIPVCVTIQIITNEIDLKLSTNDCNQISKLDPESLAVRTIINCWLNCQLDNWSYSPGDVLKFLEYVNDSIYIN